MTAPFSTAGEGIVVRALQMAVLKILDEWTRQDQRLSSTGGYPWDHKDDPTGYGWSVQGFGVLRLYIRDIGRLHIWTKALRYPGVSLVHNHSWDLASTVVAGELRNTKFTELSEYDSRGEPHHAMRLLTGYESKPLTDARHCRLLEYPGQVYWPGNVYVQAASEIHRTDALDGTITLMARNEDQNGEADVYWPAGTEWGNAKPRAARPEEIRVAIEHAMRWLV